MQFLSAVVMVMVLEIPCRTEKSLSIPDMEERRDDPYDRCEPISSMDFLFVAI